MFHRQGKKNQWQPPHPRVRPRAKFPFCGGVSLHLHKKKCIWQETLRELCTFIGLSKLANLTYDTSQYWPYQGVGTCASVLTLRC